MRTGDTMTVHKRLATAIGIAVLAVALLALGGLAACGDEPTTAPAGDPSITGVVASASPVSQDDPSVQSFLIEQGSGEYDKASVTVTADTDWYRRTTDGYEVIDTPTVGDLSGKTVEVQFTGPVRESYPVQATAGWVVVAD